MFVTAAEIKPKLTIRDFGFPSNDSKLQPPQDEIKMSIEVVAPASMFGCYAIDLTALPFGEKLMFEDIFVETEVLRCKCSRTEISYYHGEEYETCAQVSCCTV
jgi:hypothetical protein